MPGKAAFLVILALAAGPALSQSPPPDPGGPDAQDEGGALLLDDLLGELAPTLRELGRFLGDITQYEAPEILPNGDILIRRRPASPPPEGSIDL